MIGNTPLVEATCFAEAAGVKARYLKEQLPKLYVAAVEPLSSPPLSGGRAGAHKIQGIGANFIPEVLDTKIYDEVLAALEHRLEAYPNLQAMYKPGDGNCSQRFVELPLTGSNRLSGDSPFLSRKKRHREDAMPFFLCKIQEHEQVVAEAASKAEAVEDFVQTEVRMLVIKNRKLQCVNHTADGVQDAAAQKQCKSTRRDTL